ncbi:tail fiber protein [Pseudomonas protegens]|uniref:gp53-like domain-containing protein n=1 Tax=Pseudomonas protegens TaxID=380021 RepID=UPI0009C2507A|nr:hypothetical protein [Pseudomonas protegens]AQT10381.1 tail fiber protein [Pseudomonas protegens]GED73264.1 hypothetical protein PFL02_01140 [Pseudomonas fluorescens]
MDYPKSVPNVGLVNGKFVDENTTTGQVGSLIPAAWGNAVTSEILNVLSAASIEPDEQSTDQLSVAITKIIAGSGVTKEDLNKKADKATTLGGYGITDGASRTYVDDLARQLLPKAGGVVSGPIYLNNGTNDSPEFAMKTPEVEVFMDVANRWFRVFANYNGVTTFPMVVNVPEKVVYFFDNAAWHSGNFNPATKADAALVNQATENSRGTAKVASQGAVNSGVDGESFVTPKTLARGFRILLANNGYIVFPWWLGGFVVQWASGVNAAVSGGGLTSQDVQFPIPFPNAVLGGLVTSKYISGVTTVSYESASGLNNSKVGVTVANPVSSGSGVSQPRVYFFGY